MATYTSHVEWQRGDAPFVDNRYSRRHLVRFDSGVEFAGSSSPQVVRAPLSDPSAVDPEEMFVASLSSCHMLWFLSLAAGRGFVVECYVDDAEGRMAKNADGKLAMTVVTLHPDVRFGGAAPPDAAAVAALHHEAHDACFIANSVRTDVRVEPVVRSARDGLPP